MQKKTPTSKIESFEPLILMSASAVEIEGTDAGEWISGTSGDDVILAGGGDDEIYAPLGNNIIDGGDGMDALIIYEGNRADYTISTDANGDCVVEGPGQDGSTVRNTISNVEKIVFNDGWVNVADVKTDDGPTDPGDPDDGDDPDDDDDPSASDKSGSDKSGREISGRDKSGREEYG